MADKGGFVANSTDVVVEVDGKNYTVTLDNTGKGSLTVNLNKIKTYTVNAYYAGNDYYNASETATGTFEVVDKNGTLRFTLC